MAGESEDVRFFPYGSHVLRGALQVHSVLQSLLFDNALQGGDIGLVVGVTPEVHLPIGEILCQKAIGFHQKMLPFGAAGDTAHIGDGMHLTGGTGPGGEGRNGHGVGNIDETVIAEIFPGLMDKGRHERLDAGTLFQRLLLAGRGMGKDFIGVIMEHGNHRHLRPQPLQQQTARRLPEGNNHIRFLQRQYLLHLRGCSGEHFIIPVPGPLLAEKAGNFPKPLPQGAHAHRFHAGHVEKIVEMAVLREGIKRRPLLLICHDHRHMVPLFLHGKSHAGQHMLDAAAVAHEFVKICQ